MISNSNKRKITILKFQIPNKTQIPTTKQIWKLGFGDWNLFVIFPRGCLWQVLDIWNLPKGKPH
jgi:hypothetical protein